MKKLLSLILTLAMVISLVPAAFAADGDVLVYNFNRTACGVGNQSAIRVYDSAAGTYYAPSAFSDIVPAESAQWRVRGLANVNSGQCAIGESSLIVRAYENSANKPSVMSVALNVTTSGWVKTNINFNKYKASYSGGGYDGYTADIWLVKTSPTPDYDSTSLLSLNDLKNIVYGLDTNSDAKYLGQINTDLEDTADDNYVKNVSQDLEAVELTTGEYQLIINAVSEDETNSTTARRAEINSFTLTLMPEDEELTNAFTVVETPGYGYVTPTAIGIAKDDTKIETEDNDDGTYNLTAPEKNEKDANFLYWALGLTGNKRIVSFSRTLENYVPAQEGRNYLIAVYESDIQDPTTPEYYNRDGQLIAKSSTEPGYPSIPGLGTAIGWEDCGENIKVAKYEDMVRDNVTVTAWQKTAVHFSLQRACTRSLFVRYSLIPDIRFRFS